MEEGTGILPGLPAVAGKPVHVGFDGGQRLDGGRSPVVAIETVEIAERQRRASDPRDPDLGAARTGRYDPLSCLADCGGLSRRQRLRRAESDPPRHGCLDYCR